MDLHIFAKKFEIMDIDEIYPSTKEKLASAAQQPKKVKVECSPAIFLETVILQQVQC